MANNSSKNLPSLMPSKEGSKLVDEKIDERILRLLNLENVFDIDYDTYASLLREKMASARMTKKTLATEEVELITDEWKRIRRKIGRFRVKKITADSFKKGSATGIQIAKKNLLPDIRKLALPPVEGLEERNSIKEIAGILGEIVKSLTEQNKKEKKSNERERKEAEFAKRGLVESKLESGFKKAIQVAEKIVAPVKSLLSRIVDFITTIFIGRTLYLLLEWFGNKENAEKIKSISRFLSDHWPKLLALYIRFGTQFGKFVGGLSKLVIAGTLKLVQVAAKLIGAKGVSRFLGGKGGKLLGAGLTVAATVGSTMALSEGIENFAGIDSLGGEPKQPDLKPTAPEQSEQIGVLQYAGGGSINLKNLLNFSGNKFNMSGTAGDASFGPLGILLSGLGGALASRKKQQSGYVSGEKGVDKVPAMLSDGEFVMSRGAVQKYGVSTLEAMNSAGGGTNKPKMMSGTTFAQGGGLITTKPTEKELVGESQSGLLTQNKMSTSPVPPKSSNNVSLIDRIKKIELQLQNLHPQKILSYVRGGQNLNMSGINVDGGGINYQGNNSVSNRNQNYYNFSTGNISNYPGINIPSLQNSNYYNLSDNNISNYQGNNTTLANQSKNYFGPSIGDRFSLNGGKYFNMNMGGNIISPQQYSKNINLAKVFQSSASGLSPSKITQIFTPKQTAMDKWRAANPILAAAADERVRIRGTAQTDNPLISKEMRVRMPVTSTVQSPEVAKLGKGYQSLVQNPYAAISPTVKPTTTSASIAASSLKPTSSSTQTATSAINIAHKKPNLKPPEPPQQPKVVVKTVSSSDITNQTTPIPSTGGVPQVPSFSVSVSSMERRRKALTMGIIS